MKTSNNIQSNESNNGMSQVINILTGETKKIRCHYLSKRTDKPVSRVLTLERLNHPALTAAGVTAWAERFNDGVNSFDWLRVSIQLTDKICYTPNCANVGLPDVENYGNLDYYKNQEGAMRVYMNNVDNFFQSIADKPAKMMTGEDWPNMAVIAAYRAAGREKEADTLTAARDTYNARREAKNEAWSKKYAAQQYYYNSPKPKNFDELTELEKAQFMMQTAQECAKNHPELDWADILENAAKRLEKAEKEEEKAIREAEGIKVGDRVWCKHGEVMGTVTAIRIWNPDYAFKVRLDKPVTLFGRTFEETEFRRAGITKNYDRDGMIVGNAQYYTEQLKYGPASIIEYELAGVALRTESTREDVEPDSREGWGNEYRVTIHHQTGDTTETMTLSETAELLARMYQEEQGKEATLEPASEIKDIPAADLCWDMDEEGVKVWGNIDKHAENLTRMGAKRGRVVFKSNKTGLPTGADCWVLPKSKGEDVRQYVRKVHERISRDFSEAREKYGDKGHKYHEGEKVMTIYGRGTVIRGRAWYASDEIDVQLELPTYNYIWSLLGTPQKMVAVNRNDIVSIKLPEPPAEVYIDGEPTLENSGEIKPKAAFQIGDRVERKSDGERGTVDGYDVTDGKLTYIVKYDRTQRRQSDGFEYLSEELNGDELQAA